jgi:hypothetical protein
MLMNLRHSLKTPSILSLMMAAILSLVACSGGGGGGGGGGLPTKVTVEFPLDDDAGVSPIDDNAADFEIAFVNSSVNTTGLLITLNGKDVTALFSPTTGTANRTASIYSLSGFLNDGVNYFNAKVTGSAISGVTFTYDAKPEVILTALTGSGPFTAQGLTRKAILDTVTLESDINGIINASIPGDFVFAATFDTLPAVRGVLTETPPIEDTADFTLVAADTDGDLAVGVAGENNIKLIMPGSTIKYGAAVQINNAGFDVIEKWVGELLENELDTVFNEVESNPHAILGDPTSDYDDTGLTPLLGFDAADNADCRFVNAAAGITYTTCKVFVNNIETIGAVTTDVKVLDSGVPSDDKFTLEVTVSFEQLNITLDNAVFTGGGANYAGALISTLQFSVGDLTDVEFTFKVDVSKATGKIVQLSLPASPYTLQLTSDLGAVNSVCTPAVCFGNTEVEMNGDIAFLGGLASGALEDQILAELVTRLTPELEDILADASIDDTNIIYPVKNQDDEQISSLVFGLSGSAVNEATQSSTVHGGFIGLGGTTYADDEDGGNDIPALGSYFDPLNLVSSVVNRNFINSTDHVMIALSENSLNQLLLSIYQSRLLTTESITLKVSDLGDLGTDIVNLTATPLLGNNLSVVADDLVTVDFDMNAIPYSGFRTGGLELRLNALNVVITLYRACSGDTVDTCDPLYATEVNLDAKMLLGFELLASHLPQASVDDTGINIIGEVANTFLAPTGNLVIDNGIRAEVNEAINNDTLLAVIPGVLDTYVSGFVATLIEPIVQDVDLAGVGLDGKSAWLVLEDFSVDAQNEFILLTATVVDVEPTLPEIGIFRLNINDSCIDADPIPEYCPAPP